MTRKEFYKLKENDELDEDRYLSDGVYDVTGIEFVELQENNPDEEEIKKEEEFFEAHKNFYIASAYETECTILLANKPKPFKGEEFGNGFNYGSTNILTNLPKAILILAQND